MSENVRGLIRRLEENLVAAADDVDLRGRLAEAYLRVGDEKNAGQQYKEIGRLRLQRMQQQRAAGALTLAAQYLPGDLTIHEQLYTLYRLADRHEEEVATGTLLADQLRRARQFGRAEEILMRCLQVAGDRPDVRWVLAETYAGMGAPEKARPHLQHLAAHHPDERERRRSAQLLSDLERKGRKPVAANPSKNSSPDAIASSRGRQAGGPATWSWVAVGVLAAGVCGAGIYRQVHAANRSAALAEAAAMASGGDLDAAAKLLRGAGMEAEAAQADRAAADARDRTERAELAAAREQGLAPATDGGATGLDTARRLAGSAESPEVRAAATELARVLDGANADADRLRRAVDANDASGAFAAWRALRDGGQLAGLLAGAPALAAREVSIEITTKPPGASVSDDERELGITPCHIRFPIGAGRIVTVAAGEIRARIDCRDTPGPSWTVPLQRAERWRTKLRGSITGAAVADGAVYAAGADGDVVCVDAPTGHERWRRTLGPGGDLIGAPVIAGDHVVVMLGGGTLAAFGRADGTRGGPFDGLRALAPPLAHAGGVLVAEPGGALALWTPAGATAERAEWGRFDGVRSLTRGDPAIFAAGDRSVAAFEPSGGAPRWIREVDDALTGRVRQAGDWVLLARADGGVAVLDREGLAVETGNWSRTATGAAIHDGERIYFGRTGGGIGEVVEALALQDNEALALPAGVGALQYLAAHDGVVYGAGAGGRLIAWVPPERTPRWSAQLPGAPAGPPTVDGGRVLIGLRSGQLIAFAGETR